MNGKRVTIDEISKIKLLHSKGLTVKEIASIMGCSVNTVYRSINPNIKSAYNEDGIQNTSPRLEKKETDDATVLKMLQIISNQLEDIKNLWK